MNQLMKNVKRALIGKLVRREMVAAAVGGLALAGTAARADFTIDAAPIVSVITSGVTTVSAIGIAVLSLVVVIRLFKWVQRVL